MTQLDPRLNAYREDLAAASLRDRVRAAHYAEGELRQVSAPAAPIRLAPRFDAPLATEALCGELVTVYEFREGWAWVQLHDDGYAGYTPMDCLSSVIEENTHRVSARLTYLYPAPDIRRPPITKLSFAAMVAPIGVLEGRFVEILRGGFIFSDHLVGIRERAKDFVRVAERFAGTPYLWGGKTSLGIDCSGLVQVSLMAAGIPCLRDSDMQMQSAGEPMDPAKLDEIQRGDLLFWRGHVAIAQSADWMIHASGAHMEVVVEPLRRAVERIAESHGPVIAILRPPVPQQQAERIAQTGQPAMPVREPMAAEPAAAPQRSPQQPAPQVQAAAMAPRQNPAAPVGAAPPPVSQPIQAAPVAAQPPRPVSPPPAAKPPVSPPSQPVSPPPIAKAAVNPPQQPVGAAPVAKAPGGPQPQPVAAALKPQNSAPPKQPSAAPAGAQPTGPALAAGAKAGQAPSQKPGGPGPAATKPAVAPHAGAGAPPAIKPAAVQPQKPGHGPAAAKPAVAPGAGPAVGPKGGAGQPPRPPLAAANAMPPGAPPPAAGPKGQPPIVSAAKSLAAQLLPSMSAAQKGGPGQPDVDEPQGGGKPERKG
jgi:hypothetical protein